MGMGNESKTGTSYQEKRLRNVVTANLQETLFEKAESNYFRS